MTDFKWLVLILTCGTTLIAARAGDNDAVQRKIVELDRDKDGKIDLIADTFMRKSHVVLRLVKKLEKGGFWSQSRSLHVADQQIVIE